MEQNKDEPRPGETTTTKSAVTSRTTTTIMTCTPPGDVLYPEEAPYHADIEDIQRRLGIDTREIRQAQSTEEVFAIFKPDLLNYWVRYRDQAESKQFFAKIRPWVIHLCSKHPGMPSPPPEADPLLWPKWLVDAEAWSPPASPERPGNPLKADETLKDRFRFPTGQALFDGRDLGLRTEFARGTLKRLVRSAGKVVRYRTLDEDSQDKEASEKLRTAVVAIRKALRRCRTGYQITTIRCTGYCFDGKSVSTHTPSR